MRYLVRAKVRKGQSSALRQAIETGTLGAGSIAGDEYFRNMSEARAVADRGKRLPGETEVRWVEVCYCPTPLQEERPYWEEYFELTSVRDAHARSRCRDLNGEEPWACSTCDCTARLEARLERTGERFLDMLENE